MARPARGNSARGQRPYGALSARGADGVDRMDRVNELLRDTIAEVVARELKDPRLSLVLVSVTEVRASRDLGNATVMVSAMPPPDTPDDQDLALAMDAIAALNSAAPFIHRTIRRHLRMKRVPRLRFEFDPRIVGAALMQERLRALDAS